MATMQEEIQKYKAQTQQYDAGRPNTAAPQKQDAKFQPAESAGMAMPAQGRQPMKDSGSGSFTPGNLFAPGDYDKFKGTLRGLVYNERADAPSFKSVNAASAGVAARSAPAPNFESVNASAGGLTARSAAPSVSASPAANGAWAGNYAASGPDGQGIYRDPQTGRTSIRLTGEAGDKFMQDQSKAIAEGKGVSTTADEMATRRKAMGEYGGMFADRAAAPTTARPGLTLSVAPAKYVKTAGSGNVGGLPASEEWAPQQAPHRAEIPTTTGNPMADQRNAEDALARRQMEVMAAERADKTLMQAPGSRDYIDPRLSETEQRARQSEITEQRKQDMRDARDATIAQTQARDAALGYKGLPTDEARNRGMEPYAERRASINQRNANMAMAQAQETERAGAADKAAEREAKEVQDVRKDATDRYVADKSAELAEAQSITNAQSKALDREATMKAAMLKLENTKDPVLLEKLKGYNSWLEATMQMPGVTITPEQLTAAQKQFGVEELFRAEDPYAKISIPAPQG